MSSPNADFSEIITTTLDKYSPRLADNVTNNNSVLARLKRKGKITPAAGGARILENLMYQQNSTAKWYSGLEVLNVSQNDILTSANFDWKTYNANVVISGLEEIQNDGPEQIHNLIKARISGAEKTAYNDIGAALFYSNTEHNGKAIGGFQHLIADDPTAGTVGGIDRASNTWWRNQIYDFSTEGETPSATTIRLAMNKISIRTTRNRDMVDMFVADENYFEFYLNSLQENQRFTSDSEASAGFKALKFSGGGADADVFYDSSCPANHMYAINTDYLHYRPHKTRNFKVDRKKASTNQDANVIPLYWAGNMTLSNADVQGVIHA